MNGINSNCGKKKGGNGESKMAIGLRKGQSSKGLENPRKKMSGKTEKT